MVFAFFVIHFDDTQMQAILLDAKFSRLADRQQCRVLFIDGANAVDHLVGLDSQAPVGPRGILGQPHGDDTVAGLPAYVLEAPFFEGSRRIWLNKRSLFPVAYLVPAVQRGGGTNLTPTTHITVTGINTIAKPTPPGSSCA